MIKQMKIKYFKSIINQTVDFGKLNVFIGANGAGKSNILEAIGMLSAALSGSEMEYSRFSERGMRLSSPAVFRSAFKNIERKPSIDITGVMENLSYHVNLHSDDSNNNPWRYSSEEFKRGQTLSVKISGRSNRGAKVGGISIAKPTPSQSIVTATEVLSGFLEKELSQVKDLKDYAIYAPSTPILRGVSPDTSNKSPLGLYGGSLAEALNNVLSNELLRTEMLSFFKLLDWFYSLGAGPPSGVLQAKHLHTSNLVVKYKDKYMNKKFDELYAYDVSEGALYILFVIVLLVHKDSPNIFALDNVDSCLNPGLITKLMVYISDKLNENSSKQVFITTHNPTTLDAIDLFNDEHRLFVVKRGDNGGSVFERVLPPKGFTRENWAEKFYGMKLSEIWLSGAIGGLPKEGF